MKKILSIFLVLSMLAASMASCSGDTTEDTTGETTPAVEETTPVAEETEPAAEETEAETEPAAEETEPAAEETEPAVEEEPAKEGYAIEMMDTWHYLAHECTYVDSEGTIRGYAGAGAYENDKFAEWLEANPEWYKDYEMMAKWETEMAPFGDVIDSFIAAPTPFIEEPDTYQGLTIYRSFNVETLEDDSLYELWMIYDNSVYVYVNGQPYYIHDNNLSGTSDWTGNQYVQILPNQGEGDSLADYLVQGENHIAIRLKDAWGGRELEAYIWYQLDSTKRDVYLMETGADWNAIALSAPYIDGDGVEEGSVAGGTYPADLDEFAKYLAEHPDYATDYATAETWPVYTANLSDATEGLGWVGGVHGLIAHTTFEATDIEDLKTCDEWRLYGNYDNTVYLYLNGTLIYSHDGELTTADWASGEWVLDEAAIEGAIVEGTNHLVVTIKDAWGGRGMNLGLYNHWN